jgi:hypothetical protein
MALERQVPPTGEEIHIPGPSAQPLLLTIGITIALLGVTLGPLIWIPGVILTVVVLFAWIRDAREEFAHLPAEHHVAVHDTVPNPADRPHAGGPAEPGAPGGH